MIYRGKIARELQWKSLVIPGVIVIILVYIRNLRVTLLKSAQGEKITYC